MKTIKLLLASLILSALAFASPAQEAMDPLCVSDIQAEDQGGGKILLSWTLPEGKDRGRILFFAIYRDQRPIYSSARVKTLFPIAAVPKTHISYTDEAEDGKSYYYAVLTFVDKQGADDGYAGLYYDEELDGPDGESRVDEDSGMLYAAVLPGLNSTVAPVRASAGQAPGNTAMLLIPDAHESTRGGELAADDLPVATESLSKTDSPVMANTMPCYKEAPGSTSGRKMTEIIREEEETLSKEREISFQSERNAALLLPARKGSKRKATPLFRHIFSEDQLVPAGGDDWLLYEILNDGWMQYSYVQAKAKLEAFLSQNREEGATKRATFYLAEAEYFTDNYAEALNLFLTVQDSFPELAGKWIDSCIDLL
ncbi:MAG: hypothetical protein IJL80_15990 [Treponema sp.]|nr:hypothetical protein [Treponema sp.]